MTGQDGQTQLYNYSFGYHQLPGPDSQGNTAYFADPTLWGELNNQNSSGLTSDSGDLSGLSVNVGFGFGPFSATVGGGAIQGSDGQHRRTLDINGDGLPRFRRRGGSVNLNSAFISSQNPSRFSTGSSTISSPLGHTNRSGWNHRWIYRNTIGLQRGSGLCANIRRRQPNPRRPERRRIHRHPPDQQRHRSVLPRTTGPETLPPRRRSWSAPIPSSPRSVSVSEWQNAQATSSEYPIDTLVRWRAPFAGNVTISGPIQKLQTGGNGVHASIYHGNTLLWSSDVTDATPTCTPNATASGCSGNPIVLPVAAGDHIYTFLDAKGDITSDAVA